MEKEIIPSTFLRETLALRNSIEGAFLELAKRLYTIRKDSLWREQYESFEGFLSEMKTSKSTASKLISIYETFVITHKIPENKLIKVGWGSLYTIVPYADSKLKAEQLVEKATVLTRQHLSDELKLNPKMQEACDHDFITMQFCTKCGVRHRIYEAE